MRYYVYKNLRKNTIHIKRKIQKAKKEKITKSIRENIRTNCMKHPSEIDLMKRVVSTILKLTTKSQIESLGNLSNTESSDTSAISQV